MLIRALGRLVKFQLSLAVSRLFLPAGTVLYWEGWLFWSVFGISNLAITLYFLRHDSALIRRRLEVGPGAERRLKQKILQAIASALVCVLVVVPGNRSSLSLVNPADRCCPGCAPSVRILHADGFLGLQGEQLHVRDGRGRTVAAGRKRCYCRRSYRGFPISRSPPIAGRVKLSVDIISILSGSEMAIKV